MSKPVHYDAGMSEILFIDSAPLLGRKADLRQLVKLLSLAKAGEVKTVLVSGEPGIGKTALLQSFTSAVRKGGYCRMVEVAIQPEESPESLYVNIIDALQQECHGILDDALAAVNEILTPLEVQWERSDLVRAVALVKLQESIGGEQAAGQDQLVKALRSSLPSVKKFKLTVNESIEKLVSLIVNPWILVATSLLNPMNPKLQESIQLAESLKQRHYQPLDADGVNTPLPAEKPPEASSEALPPGEILVQVSPEPGSLVPVVDLPLTRPAEPSPESIGVLASHLVNVFAFINKAIQTLETAVVLVLDDWDALLTAPEDRREKCKEFVADFLREITYRKNFHLMLALACRSERESYALGGALYSLLRSKVLVSGLSESNRRKLFQEPLMDAGLAVEPGVLQAMSALTLGNPFWVNKLRHYVQERAQSNHLQRIDLGFFNKLAVGQPEDLLSLSFTRLKLAFLNDEEALLKVIAALLRQVGTRPFQVQDALRELSASQKMPNRYVFEVLRQLFGCDFLVALSPGAGEDPVYCVQSRLVQAFLQDKTQTIQTDVSTDEKITYLKKIIPLSVKSAELDREKTLEVLALSKAVGNDDLVLFLEETFLEHLNDEKPVVRVTALNNLATLDSERSFHAVVTCMKDPDPMVREYAARSLGYLASKPGGSVQQHQRIVNTLMQSLDDEAETVRGQVYDALSHYKLAHDLTKVFLKGLSDVSETVRLASIKALVELEVESPFIQASFVDALEDPLPAIRYQACLGLAQYPNEQTIEVLTRVLREEPESSVRVLVADLLSHMEDRRAMEALVAVLLMESRKGAVDHEAEDVQLAVARALGRRKGWQSEEALLQVVEAFEERSPTLLWSCIRSLGNVGGTERSLSVLQEVEKRHANDIVTGAATWAARKVAERMADLQQMEHQLQTATPLVTVVAVDEDLRLLEDEALEDPLEPATR